MVNIYLLKQIFERGELNKAFRAFGHLDDRTVKSKIINNRILKPKEINWKKTDIYVFIFAQYPNVSKNIKNNSDLILYWCIIITTLKWVSYLQW